LKATNLPENQEKAKSIRVQKRTVLSDEEADEPKRLGKKRKSVVDDEDERSLKAMMDIDDESVSRASGVGVDHEPPPRAEKVIDYKEEEETDEPSPSLDAENRSQGQFIDKKPRKPRKSAVKDKDVPLDSKGRKKRKVTKSRKEKDRKGRTITVDYSSWESASEDESVPGTSDRDSNPQNGNDHKAKSKPRASPTATQPKPVAKSSSKAGDLRGFFSSKTT